MVIIFGQEKYGKTERLPGLFHVVTEFFHLYYFPLIPMGSTVMREGQGERINAKVTLSWRSILIAYLRAATLMAGIIFTLWSLIQMLDGRNFYWEVPLVAVLAWPLFALTYLRTKPSPERALMLANKLDIPLEQLIDYYLDDSRIEQLMQQRQSEPFEPK